MNDALDLFFELSSDDRLQILLTLEKKPNKLLKLSITNIIILRISFN